MSLYNVAATMTSYLNADPRTLLGERQIRSLARHVCHLDHDPDIGDAIDLLHKAGWVVIRPRAVRRT